jgi:hypothetical protein
MNVQKKLHEHVDTKYYDFCVMLFFLIEIHEQQHQYTVHNDEAKERAARLSKLAMIRIYFPMLEDYIIGKPSANDKYYQTIKEKIIKIVYGMLLKNPAIRAEFKYYKFEQYLVKRIDKLMVAASSDNFT